MISFVLPVYNSSSSVANTIESLIDQEKFSSDIVVVDDGSTDDISDLRDHYSSYPFINWITNNERKGAAYCRNIGNEAAKMDLIGVCDAGDYYPPNRAREIIKFFEDTDNHLFYSDVQVNQPSGNPLYIQKAEKWDGIGKPPISHPTIAYLTHGLPRYHEVSVETDLYEIFLHDCFRKGLKFGFVNKTLCVKVDMSSSPHYRDVKKAKDVKYEMYQKYGIEIERSQV